MNPENLNRPAQPEPATDAQHADPSWLPKPQFWVSAADLPFVAAPGLIGFKDVTSPANNRSMIAAFVPSIACGNALPLLTPDSLAAGDSLLLGTFPIVRREEEARFGRRYRSRDLILG